MFKDTVNKLRTVDFEDNTLNLHAVSDQKLIKNQIKDLGTMAVKSKTPVLCLLYDL